MYIFYEDVGTFNMTRGGGVRVASVRVTAYGQLASAETTPVVP